MPVSDIPVNGDNVAGPVGPPSASGFDAVGPSIPGAEIKGDIIDLIGTVQPADIAGERCLYRPQDTVVQLRLKGPALPPGKPDYNSDEAEKFQNRGWKDNAEPAAGNSGKTARKYKERKTKGIKQDWHNQRTSGRKFAQPSIGVRIIYFCFRYNGLNDFSPLHPFTNQQNGCESQN